MTSRQRVLETLKGKKTDCPPWMELGFHPIIASKLLGEKFDKRGGSGFFGFFDDDSGTNVGLS
jgi:hypothetical protein